ncbi:transporter, partial [Corynebacterium pyruviciproducens]
MASVFEYLAGNGVLLLFILVGVGMIFGHIKIRGIGMGSAAVLFVAIGLSAWANAYGVELKVDHLLGIFGLCLLYTSDA